MTTTPDPTMEGEADVAREAGREVVLDQLATTTVGSRVLQYDSLDSSNLEALRLAEQAWAAGGRDEVERALPRGSVIWALTQREGQGRHGRRWESPAGGLWFTVVFPGVSDDELAGVPLMNLATSLAVTEALEGLGVLDTRVKWPNDVYLVTPEEDRGARGSSESASSGELVPLSDSDRLAPLDELFGGPAAADLPEALPADESNQELEPMTASRLHLYVDQAREQVEEDAKAPTGADAEGASAQGKRVRRFIPGRKLCGVLTQVTSAVGGTDAANVSHVAIGVGINVNQTATDFPPELRGKVSSLALWAHHKFELDRVLWAVLTQMDRQWRELERGRHAAMLAGLESRALLARSKLYIELPDGRVLVGRYAGLTEKGHLRLRPLEGATDQVVEIPTGEVIRARRLTADE